MSEIGIYRQLTGNPDWTSERTVPGAAAHEGSMREMKKLGVMPAGNW